MEKKKTVPDTSRSNFRLLSISFLLGIAVVYPFLKYALVEPWLFSYEGGDFTIYYKAAQRLTAGRSPYPLDKLESPEEHGSSPIWGEYPYPPMLARLLIPATRLPVIWAKRVYIGICLTAFFWILVPLLRNRFESPAQRWAAAAVLLGWGPFIYSIRLGQCELLAIPFIALAWRWMAKNPDPTKKVARTQSEFAAGVMLGIASMVRVTPIVILPILIVTFRWRLAVSFVVGAVGALLLSGPLTSYTFFTEVLPSMSDVGGMRYCPAFHVLFLDTIDTLAPLTRNPPFWLDHARLISVGASGLFYAAVLGFLYTRRNRFSSLHLVFIGCYLAPLLAGKNPHHYTLALFPILAATDLLVRRLYEGKQPAENGKSGSPAVTPFPMPWLESVFWVAVLAPGFSYWFPVKKAVEGFVGVLGIGGNVAFILSNVAAFLFVLFLFTREGRRCVCKPDERLPLENQVS